MGQFKDTFPIAPHNPLGFCWDCDQEQPLVPDGNNFVCIKLGHRNVTLYRPLPDEPASITLASITTSQPRIVAHNDAINWFRMSGGQWEVETILQIATQQSKRLHAMNKPDFIEAFMLSYLYYKEQQHDGS